MDYLKKKRLISLLFTLTGSLVSQRFIFTFFFFFLEIVSCYIVQASLKTMLGQTEPPKCLGLQASIHLWDLETKSLYFCGS